MSRSEGMAALRADPTPDKLKFAAIELFSRRGIDGVSVRDIVSAAGVRNGGSLHYYFGSKEGLIRELIIDSAKRSDAMRHRRLSELEAQGGPKSIAEVARIIVEVETAGGEEGSVAPPTGFGHMRFIMALQINHRRLFQQALEGDWNASYLRCLEHFRQLLPEVPPAILRQRFVFMYLYLVTILAARESAFDASRHGGSLWSKDFALDNMIDTLCALLACPLSAETEAKLHACQS